MKYTILDTSSINSTLRIANISSIPLKLNILLLYKLLCIFPLIFCIRITVNEHVVKVNRSVFVKYILWLQNLMYYIYILHCCHYFL